MNSFRKKGFVIISLLVLTTLLASCGKDNEYVKNVTVKEKKIVNTIKNDSVVIEKSSDDTMENTDNNLIESKGEGEYKDYSASAISEAEGNIVLFFHADWCSTCVKTEKDIISKGVPENLTILNTSFDNELELRKKYGVTKQTTFVQIDNEGEMIKKWSGSKDLADIIKNTEVSMDNEEKEIEVELNQEKEIEVMLNDEKEFSASKGEYKDYSTSAVSEAEGNIVLFFHADWCPTCVAAEKDIISKGVPDNLTILKANYDKELDLRKKYGVVAQTTFVQVDNKGNLIKKWVGGRLSDIVEKVGE